MRSLVDTSALALRAAACACAAAVCMASHAGVASIYEGGPTVPVGQYLVVFLSQDPAAPVDNSPSQANPLPMAFPIATPSMRPGRLPSAVHLRTPGWLVSPMFIVGDDAQSRQWLSAHRDTLRSLGASGLVVNVLSLEAFRSLRSIAPELPMAPGSLDELARQMGLSVYPLFVGADGRVTQQVPQ